MCFDFITNISHSPGCDRKLSDYYENHCLARTVIMLYISYIVQYNTASAIKFTRPGSCLGASFCFSFLPMRTAECGAATNSVGCALQFSISFFFVQKKWKRARACVSRLPSPTLFSLPPHPFVGERGILFCYKCRERVTRTGRAQAGTGHPTWRESLAAVLRRRGEAGGRRGIAVIVCFCASFYLD